MLLPLFGWAVTGAIFFIKPGYSGAYELLAIKTYPIDTPIVIAPREGWTELRYVRTVLGDHVLVRTPDGWQHLNPAGLSPVPAPPPDDVKKLLEDAFVANPARYGRVARVEGLTATTDTGVVVTVDWKRLALSQRGPDTERIDRYYKIHYLQWTGYESIDRVLGGLGLLLVVVLSVLGAWIFFRPR